MAAKKKTRPRRTREASAAFVRDPHDLPSVGVAVIAAALEVGPRRVRGLAEEGSIPRPAHGAYDLLACVIAHRAKTVGSPVDGDRARKMRAEADLAEMQLATERRELVPLAEAEAAIDRLASSYREAILAIASRFAHQFPELPAAERVGRLKAIAADLIAQLRARSLSAGEESSDA